MGKATIEKMAHRPMSAEPEVVTAMTEYRALAVRIKRSVRRHAGGGVRSLDVQVDRESIRLSGQCASFYCKQLAQQAALRLSAGVQVINGIEVDC